MNIKFWKELSLNKVYILRLMHFNSKNAARGICKSHLKNLTLFVFTFKLIDISKLKKKIVLIIFTHEKLQSNSISGFINLI